MRRIQIAIATLAALAGVASPAQAVPRAQPARPFEVGFADSLFGTEQGDVWAKRTARAGADAVRVNLYWSLVAPTEPEHPRRPDDPAYDWEPIDRAVLAADRHGLDVLMTVLAAPAWAEGPGRPSFALAPAGSWRPDAAAYGDFAHAVAERYSGSHPVPVALGPGELPEVDLFAAWNEPNISAYLAPQYAGGENVSPGIYAGLLDAFYSAVKEVNPEAVVSTGGTAPFGDPVGHRRTAPLAFWRGLMCLTPELLRDRGCAIERQPRFDVLAHHPISYLSSPAVPAGGDDMTVADIGELGAALRAAEAARTIGPAAVAHRLIVPEIWWESRPGERRGISARQQARYTELAMYLLWRQGVDGVWFLQVRDSASTTARGAGRLSSYQTGIYTYGGRRKPVYAAVRFPLVTDRIERRSTLAWGRVPRSGTLRLQVRRRGQRRWRTVSRRRVRAGNVFTTMLAIGGRARVRARVGPTRSLPWRPGRRRAYPPPR